MSAVSFSIAFTAGFLTFLSPCLLPLVPVYVSYITGISFDELKEGKRKDARRKILIHSALFVLGFSAVFMALGASASYVGNFLIAYKTIMSRIGGAFIILLGFYFIGFFKFDFLGRERRIKFKPKGGSKPGSFLLGAVFAFAWTPCVGPVLGSILMLAGIGKTMREGMALLGFYSLGIAVPFIITALLINLLLPYFAKFQKYFFTVKLLCGVLLMLLGVLLVTDNFGWISGAFAPR